MRLDILAHLARAACRSVFPLIGLALAAVSSTAQASEPSASVAPPVSSGQLLLEVMPMGIDHPWTYRITNSSLQPLEIVDEATYFWLSVTLSASSSAQQCKLPEAFKPLEDDTTTTQMLAPGAHLDRNFDPRLYCFSAEPQQFLLPGTRIQPQYGWPLLTTSHTVEKSNSSPPTSAISEGKELKASMPKPLVGASIVLGGSYSRWAQPHPEQSPPPSLVLQLLLGSDAQNAHSATVTVAVANHSKQPQSLPLRPESVQYEISGPGGTSVCPARNPGRPRSEDSLTRLEPEASKQFTTLLFEVCPHSAFSEPGLYRIDASLVFKTGELESQQPVYIRLHRGVARLRSKQLGRILSPSSPKRTSNGKPPRPTRRDRPPMKLKLPQVDILE